MTPYRSTVPGRDGFGQLLARGGTKLRSVRGWMLTLGAAVVLTVAVSLLTAVGSGSGFDGDGRRDAGRFEPRSLRGDGSVAARVVAQQGDAGAKAGLHAPLGRRVRGGDGHARSWRPAAVGRRGGRGGRPRDRAVLAQAHAHGRRGRRVRVARRHRRGVPSGRSSSTTCRRPSRPGRSSRRRTPSTSAGVRGRDRRRGLDRHQRDVRGAAGVVAGDRAPRRARATSGPTSTPTTSPS